MQTRAFVTLGLGLALAVGAHAATYELPSPLSPTPQSLEITVPQRGAFADVINFTVAQNAVATFGATRERGKSHLFISVFNDGNRLLFGSHNYVLGSLQVGSYYAAVNGIFRGKNNEYSFTALAAPVPLPAAIWLLAGGLIGFLFVARRRGQSMP